MIYCNGIQFLTGDGLKRHSSIDTWLSNGIYGAGLMRKLSEPPFEDFDEHDSPTEPMSAIVLSPNAVPSPNGLQPYGVPSIPAPQPPEIAFPGNGQPVTPFAPLPETPDAYPVLPASPLKHGKGRPPGGGVLAGEQGRLVRAQPRQSSIPIVV